jgi:hypothetical protein
MCRFIFFFESAEKDCGLALTRAIEALQSVASVLRPLEPSELRKLSSRDVPNPISAMKQHFGS